jgi:GNAT superfamily N-acetyltransferase
MQSHSIERLQLDAVPAAGAMLGRAFVADPFFTYMDPSPETRGRRVQWYLEANARACVLLGSAYVTTGAMAGVALWIPQGQGIDTEIERESGLTERAQIFGPETEARYAILGRAFGEAHQQIAPEPHHYLTILGVDPDHQGQGIGGALLRPFLAEADQDGVLCYVETTRSRNVPFYERHGFVVADAREVEGVPFWTFRREPRSQMMSATTGID